MASQIESVIVLMLENRSWDHMLGFLPHPNPDFPRLTGEESNPAAEPSAPPVKVSPSARPTLALDPAHNHADVMLQLTGRRAPQPPYALNNSGFVASYEGVGLRKKKRHGFGPLIMKCQPPANVPVLAELATNFGVCTRWFSSVPGQTWPNRNFAHSATSDGEVDNSLRFYTNPTIFELLGAAGRRWRIYHRGAAQSWAFRKLWSGAPGGGFGRHRDLLTAIAENALPHYAFVEPDHFWPRSSSQHPSNNEKKGNDFFRGEALIREIYNALVAHPAVFAKTVFLITYDEHGGLFDSVAPPYDPRYRDGRVAPGGFTFDLLGVRVPTVLVSPLIHSGTIDEQIYDHSSIVATVRRLIIPEEEALTPRDEQAQTFDHNLSLATPRTSEDLPSLPEPPVAEAEPVPTLDEAPDETELDDFQESLVWLTEKVAAELQQEGIDVSPSPEVREFTAEAEEVTPISVMPLRLRQEEVGALLRMRTGGAGATPGAMPEL